MLAYVRLSFIEAVSTTFSYESQSFSISLFTFSKDFLQHPKHIYSSYYMIILLAEDFLDYDLELSYDCDCLDLLLDVSPSLTFYCLSSFCFFPCFLVYFLDYFLDYFLLYFFDPFFYPASSLSYKSSSSSS